MGTAAAAAAAAFAFFAASSEDAGAGGAGRFVPPGTAVTAAVATRATPAVALTAATGSGLAPAALACVDVVAIGRPDLSSVPLLRVQDVRLREKGKGVGAGMDNFIPSRIGARGG
jgi:hypothetical protein